MSVELTTQTTDLLLRAQVGQPPWVKESPFFLSERANPIFAIRVNGATTITGPDAKIYRGTTDMTSTNMSGSASASGNVITLPTIQALVGGNDYVVSVSGTVDSMVDEYKHHLIVQKSSDQQSELGVLMPWVWLRESPYAMSERANPIFTIRWNGATVITSPDWSAAVKLYKGTTDVTATHISSPASASGRIITLPTISGLLGGNEYVLSIKATVEGVVDERKLHLIVQKKSDPHL